MTRHRTTVIFAARLKRRTFKHETMNHTGTYTHSTLHIPFPFVKFDLIKSHRYMAHVKIKYLQRFFSLSTKGHPLHRS